MIRTLLHVLRLEGAFPDLAQGSKDERITMDLFLRKTTTELFRLSRSWAVRFAQHACKPAEKAKAGIGRGPRHWHCSMSYSFGGLIFVDVPWPLRVWPSDSEPDLDVDAETFCNLHYSSWVACFWFLVRFSIVLKVRLMRLLLPR